MKVCPACQSEYIDVAVRCADCGVALMSPAEAAEAETERVRHHEGDEVEFELSEWSAEERALLAGRLNEAAIAHRWEGGNDTADVGWVQGVTAHEAHATLVVAEVDADRVEEILDDVEFPDALEPVVDADADDEASYQVMSDLFVAADRLRRNPADGDAADELVAAREAAASASLPYGVEIRVWEQVQEVAAAIAASVGAGDDDGVARDAATLRGLLARYV